METRFVWGNAKHCVWILIYLCTSSRVSKKLLKLFEQWYTHFKMKQIICLMQGSDESQCENIDRTPSLLPGMQKAFVNGGDGGQLLLTWLKEEACGRALGQVRLVGGCWVTGGRNNGAWTQAKGEGEKGQIWERFQRL